MGYSVRVESTLKLPENRQDAETVLAAYVAVDEHDSRYGWQFDRRKFKLFSELERNYYADEFTRDLIWAHELGFRGEVLCLGEDGEKWKFLLDEEGISEQVAVVSFRPKSLGFQWKPAC